MKKVVMLEEEDTIEVQLSADEDGQVALGIRLNGSEVNTLSENVTMPKAGKSKKWSKDIGEIV